MKPRSRCDQHTLPFVGSEPVVGPPAVGAGDPAELLPEERFELALVSVRRDSQQRVGLAERTPEGAPPAAKPPAGLVDVHCRSRTDLALERSVRSGGCLTAAVHDRVDRAGRNRAAEQLTEQLDQVASRDTVADSERRDRGLEPRPERPEGDPGREPGTRDPAAAGAADPVESMLGHDHSDRRQLGDLAACRLAGRDPLRLSDHAAAATPVRPMLNDLVDALERLEPTAVTGITRLPARPTIRLRPLPLRRPGRILARRQRRVPRAPAQPPLELLHPSSQLRDLRVLKSDPFRQRHKHHDHRVTTLLVNSLRLSPLHTTRFDTRAEDPSSD